MTDANDFDEGWWRWIHKACRDYLLMDRAHQSTRARSDDMSDEGWLSIEGGQVLLDQAQDALAKAKRRSWDYLAQGVAGTRFASEWASEVRGLSAGQVAFICGTYATCFIETVDEESGEVYPPRGVPRVRSAWAYHGLHVVEGGKAPRYKRGSSAGFDRDLRAKLIHRVGGMTYRHENYYQGRYYARRERTAQTHPDWTDGHSHADALRYVTKEILKDWWRVLNGQKAHAVLAGSEAAKAGT